MTLPSGKPLAMHCVGQCVRYVVGVFTPRWSHFFNIKNIYYIYTTINIYFNIYNDINIINKL